MCWIFKYWVTKPRFSSRKRFCLAKGPSIKSCKLWRLWFEALSVLSKIVPVNCWMWRPTQWKGEHFGVEARLWWGLGGNLGSVQTRQSIRQRVTPPSIALHRPWYATAAKHANSKLRSALLRSVSYVCYALRGSITFPLRCPWLTARNMSAAAAKKLRGVASGYISRTLLAQSVTFSFDIDLPL